MIKDDDDVFAPAEPTLTALLEKRSLKWIFVGKGGVGKTTCSCCLASLLAQTRKNVLIISTDPAHNLSDAFKQKFGKTPSLVDGFTNLFAMEIDPSKESIESSFGLGGDDDQLGMLKDLVSNMPGIDEAMAFSEVMLLVQSLEFDTIVFDTAPTGHTLRFLQFPSVMEKGLGQLIALKNKFSGIFNSLSSMMGGDANPTDMQNKLEERMKVIKEVDSQFKNKDLTTFVCVCIPEFLSVYETERLVQELTRMHMDVGNVIVNQILFPEHGSTCGFCAARVKMQGKYLDQIADLYEDFHVVKMPMLKHEIRGRDDIAAFSRYLVNPYEEEYKKAKQ